MAVLVAVADAFAIVAFELFVVMLVVVAVVAVLVSSSLLLWPPLSLHGPRTVPVRSPYGPRTVPVWVFIYFALILRFERKEGDS